MAATVIRIAALEDMRSDRVTGRRKRHCAQKRLHGPRYTLDRISGPPYISLVTAANQAATKETPDALRVRDPSPRPQHLGSPG